MGKFPKANNREFFRPNREYIVDIREICEGNRDLS